MTVVDAEARPRQAPTKWWHRPVVALLTAVIWTVGALPAPVAYALADLLAVPWALVWLLRDRRGRGRKGYWRNVAIVFRPGGLLAERPRWHLWRWARHLTWLAVDTCRMHRIDKQSLARHVDLRDMPLLHALLAEGKGIVFATAHIGVWDVAGYTAALEGLRLTSVFRPSGIPALDRLIARLRTASGQTVVAKWNAMRTLQQALAAGGSVGLLCDSAGRRGTVFPPFLGTAAATVATPALLHLSTGAPIAVVTAPRTGRFRFDIRVWDVIRHPPTGNRQADVIAILTRINRSLTAAVAATPEQWFWQSRRFKYRPDGELPGADGLPPVAAPSPNLHLDPRSP